MIQQLRKSCALALTELGLGKGYSIIAENFDKTYMAVWENNTKLFITYAELTVKGDVSVWIRRFREIIT